MFTCLYDYNLYTLNNHNYKSLYHIDFGDYNIENKDIDKGQGHLYKKIDSGEKIDQIDILIENDNHFSFSYAFKRRIPYFVIIQKSSKKIFNSLYANNSIIHRSYILGKHGKDKFIAISSPETIKKYNSSFNKDSISNMQNDYLLIFSINEVN